MSPSSQSTGWFMEVFPDMTRVVRVCGISVDSCFLSKIRLLVSVSFSNFLGFVGLDLFLVSFLVKRFISNYLLVVLGF